MTNAQIIFNESIKLVEAGIIGTTGRTFEYETDDGEKVTVPEPEPLHTFAMWKQLGRQVKKGQHAKAAFMIWKQGKASKAAREEAEKNGEAEPAGRMFQKKAFFFTLDQTEPLKSA
jgi:hypothetical protein